MKKLFILASLLSMIFFYGTFNSDVRAESSSPEISETNTTEENLVKDEQLRSMLNMMIFERAPEENIRKEDLETIKEISLTGMTNIEDWSWLQHCTNLEILDLGNTNFSDAGLIKSKKLTKLVLAATPLEHANALRELVNLESLNLSELAEAHDDDDSEPSDEHEHSAMFDMAILSDMKALKSLSIFEVGLKNADSLSSLTNLEELDASMC